MGWLYLAIAIVSEVCGTLSLRMAANGRKAWYAAVAAGYAIAFVLLALTLAQGIGLAVAYGGRSRRSADSHCKPSLLHRVTYSRHDVGHRSGHRWRAADRNRNDPPVAPPAGPLASRLDLVVP